MPTGWNPVRNMEAITLLAGRRPGESGVGAGARHGLRLLKGQIG
jgi:hypothetical protein